MKDDLKFVLPSKLNEVDVLEFYEDFYINDKNYQSVAGMFPGFDYTKWLQRVSEYHQGIVNEGHVPSSTYLVYNKADDLVGVFTLRHRLNDYLSVNGLGHVGYAVRPKFRLCGYATNILRRGLDFCVEKGLNEVEVGCFESNVGSIKVIENNGGRLVRKFNDSKGKTRLVFNILHDVNDDKKLKGEAR